MNKTNFALIAVLVASVLAGCRQQADLGPLRDVPYYTANPEERAAMIARCEADPGRLDLHSNCINARESQWKQTMDADNATANPENLGDQVPATSSDGVPRIPKDFHEKN